MIALRSSSDLIQLSIYMVRPPRRARCNALQDFLPRKTVRPVPQKGAQTLADLALIQHISVPDVAFAGEPIERLSVDGHEIAAEPPARAITAFLRGPTTTGTFFLGGGFVGTTASHCVLFKVGFSSTRFRPRFSPRLQCRSRLYLFFCHITRMALTHASKSRFGCASNSRRNSTQSASSRSNGYGASIITCSITSSLRPSLLSAASLHTLSSICTR